MIQTYKLTAELRTVTGKPVKKLRQVSIIPGVMYGHGVAPQSVQVARVEFQKLYREAGESSLVDLTIAGAAPVKVLITDTQVDPLRNDVIHIDFRQVRMDEKLDAEIELVFVNEAPAVKELGGTLVRNLDHLAVRCLPNALVHEIEVSIASLKTFEDKIHVSDIALPEGMEVRMEATAVVAMVEAPRTDEEMKALETAPEAAAVGEVKVIAEEKKAERDAAKGEVAGDAKDAKKKKE